MRSFPLSDQPKRKVKKKIGKVNRKASSEMIKGFFFWRRYQLRSGPTSDGMKEVSRLK